MVWGLPSEDADIKGGTLISVQYSGSSGCAWKTSHGLLISQVSYPDFTFSINKPYYATCVVLHVCCQMS